MKTMTYREKFGAKLAGEIAEQERARAAAAEAIQTLTGAMNHMSRLAGILDSQGNTKAANETLKKFRMYRSKAETARRRVAISTRRIAEARAILGQIAAE